MSFFSSSQGKQQKTKKEQLADQNFANNTLFMALSDIQAIQQKYIYNKPQSKQFGKYDPVDYSSREIQVLKEQLRLKLILVRSSLQCFTQDYGSGSYKLPRQFDQKKVQHRIELFQKTFQAKNDWDCYHMCQDLKNMLSGKNSNLSFESKRFKNAPSVSQQQNIKGMVEAGNKMRDIKKQFDQNYIENMVPEDNRFKSNPAFINPYQQEQPKYKRIKFQNGEYEGETDGQKPHGSGTQYLSYGIYQGAWKNGVLEGQGIFRDTQGHIYKQTYKNGKRTYCAPSYSK